MNNRMNQRLLWGAPQLLLAMALLTGCRRGATTAGEAGRPPAVLLSLERGACMGRCPEYSVSLFDDGSVQFAGRRNVAVIGDRQGRVSASAVRKLHHSLLKAGFGTADAAYGVRNPACGQYIADTPPSRLSAQVDGQLRTVTHEAGCTGAPAYLRRFGDQIDSLARTSQWVRASERTP